MLFHYVIRYNLIKVAFECGRLQVCFIENFTKHFSAYLRTHSAGKLRFSPDDEYDFTCNDLIDKGEIGRGNFGTVSRMLHTKSGTVLAVKVRILWKILELCIEI